MPKKVEALNETRWQHGLADLCARDARLSRVVDDRGPPPFWVRPAGWQTLVKIILEQQVSLSSGRAVYRRLAAAVNPLTAANLATCSITTLRQAGLTRQKAGYCRELAILISAGKLRLSQLSRLDDDTVRTMLCAINGIGPWTADVYLLMALRRPDVWPPGDIALIRAIGDLYDVSGREEVVDLADGWRPWRAIAARVLWHDYLQRRGRTVDAT